MNFKYLIPTLVALLTTVGPLVGQTIQPGTALRITVSGVPGVEKANLDGMYPVAESGTVNMPFIGPIRAAGLQSDKLAQALQQRYRSEGYYTNPTFQVVLSSTQGEVKQEVVTVGGQVRQPGPTPHNRNLTIYQAIQARGGATEFGNMKRVKLFRGGSQKQYDLTQSQFMRIPLEPNDTIEVPQKGPFGR